MKTLQMHIPRCNKSDKASILDDAIEYIKSLQLQIQMMYSGYAMFPMMYPGIQQYSPPLGLSTPGCLVPQNMLPFPPAMHEPSMLNSISSNLSSMMPIRSTCPPSITPRAETSHQDPESFSFLRASYPKQVLNFQNLYPNYFGHLHAETLSENRTSDFGKGKEKHPRMPN